MCIRDSPESATNTPKATEEATQVKKVDEDKSADVIQEVNNKGDKEKKADDKEETVGNKNPIEELEAVLTKMLFDSRKKAEEYKKRHWLRVLVIDKAAKTALSYKNRLKVKGVVRSMLEDHALIGIFLTTKLGTTQTARLTIYLTKLMSTFMTSSTFYNTPAKRGELRNSSECESLGCMLLERMTSLDIVDLAMIAINIALTIPLALIGLIFFSSNLIEKVEDLSLIHI
eukprot:TRINITY_DN16794_c0_g1_i1.p1 TRINITY_DN16794_c0_g1~~TRINITY_DN16794_c0_g1_i1.p1  ORF type:complete len:248 (-),score=57.56 TRINITY_DN16794_c0_g1_i1:57-743(-)